jgi:glycosyltransferase involved in cell wall biosynthesis
MRVCFLAPTLNKGGGTRVLAIYSRQLAAMGHKVCIVSQDVSAAHSLKDRLRSMARIGVRNHFRYERSSFGPNVSFFENDPLIEHVVIKGGRIPNSKDVPDGDCVIATWWETAEWLKLLPKSKGKQFYFVQHYELFDYLPIERVRSTYQCSAKKIVIAKWLQDVLRSEYGDTNSVVVPNAVDRNAFYSEVRKKQSRPTIGLMFAQTPFKGLEIALSVVRKLKQQFHNLRVLSFGTAPMSKAIRDELGIEFYFDPPQTLIREVYASVDLWLTASHSEGFNLPAMEAMACRTPVVATKTGWPIEAIKRGVNGFLAEVGDVHGLYVGCSQILAATPSQWFEMSEAAYATVKHSSWDCSARQFESALLA